MLDSGRTWKEVCRVLHACMHACIYHYLNYSSIRFVLRQKCTDRTIALFFMETSTTVKVLAIIFTMYPKLRKHFYHTNLILKV
jgi:hypothetical protein